MVFSPRGVEPHFLTSISPDYDGDPICQEDQEVTVQVEGAKKKHMCPQMSQCLNSFCQSSSFDCFWSLHIYIYTHTTLLSLDKHLTNCNPQEIEKLETQK